MKKTIFFAIFLTSFVIAERSFATQAGSDLLDLKNPIALEAADELSKVISPKSAKVVGVGQLKKRYYVDFEVNGKNIVRVLVRRTGVGGFSAMLKDPVLWQLALKAREDVTRSLGIPLSEVDIMEFMIQRESRTKKFPRAFEFVLEANGYHFNYQIRGFPGFTNYSFELENLKNSSGIDLLKKAKDYLINILNPENDDQVGVHSWDGKSGYLNFNFVTYNPETAPLGKVTLSLKKEEILMEPSLVTAVTKARSQASFESGDKIQDIHTQYVESLSDFMIVVQYRHYQQFEPRYKVGVSTLEKEISYEYDAGTKDLKLLSANIRAARTKPLAI